MIKHRNFN